MHVKYPRTPHLPWSPGVHSDDRVIEDTLGLEGRRIIVTEKLDGENTTMYRDKIHARSLSSQGSEDRAWVKQLWSKIAHLLPEGRRICGENVWAKHSIAYNNLLSYFYGFSVWDEELCLSWDETVAIFQELGIIPVPVLYDGPWSRVELHQIEKQLDWNKNEGYVVRVADGFPRSEFKARVAKFVRPGHVQTDKHWRSGPLLRNGLKA